MKNMGKGLEIYWISHFYKRRTRYNIPNPNPIPGIIYLVYKTEYSRTATTYVCYICIERRINYLEYYHLPRPFQGKVSHNNVSPIVPGKDGRGNLLAYYVINY